MRVHVGPFTLWHQNRHTNRWQIYECGGAHQKDMRTHNVGQWWTGRLSTPSPSIYVPLALPPPAVSVCCTQRPHARHTQASGLANDGGLWSDERPGETQSAKRRNKDGEHREGLLLLTRQRNRKIILAGMTKNQQLFPLSKLCIVAWLQRESSVCSHYPQCNCRSRPGIVTNGDDINGV